MRKRLFDFVQKHKNIIISLVVLLAALAVALLFFVLAVLPKAQGYTTRFTTGQQGQGYLPPLEDGAIIRQPFTLKTEDPLYGFEMTIFTYGETVENLEINGTIYDTKAEQKEAGFSEKFSIIKDGEKIFLSFDTPLQAPKGEYVLNFRLHFLEDETPITLPFAGRVLPRAAVDGEPQSGSLSLSFLGDSWFLISYYWIIAGALALFLAVFWYLAFARKAKIQNLFLLGASVLGILYMFVYLPYSFADSDVHVRKALFFSDQMLGAETTQMSAGSYWDRRSEDSMEGFTRGEPTRQNYLHIYNNLFSQAENTQDTTLEAMPYVGTFVQYLFPILGTALAKLLGLGQVPTLYIGQLFGLAVFLAVLYCIIRAVPFKTFFCLLGLTPFVLHVAGSFSYDAIINLLAFAYAGLVFSLAYQDKRVSVLHKILLIGLGLLLAPQKLIYTPLLFLVLLIPADKWFSNSRLAPATSASQHRRRKRLALVLLVVATLALAVIVIWPLAAPQLGGFGQESGYDPLYGKTYTYQLIFTNFAEYLRLVLYSTLDTFGKTLSAGVSFPVFPLPIWVMFILVFLYVASLSPLENQLLPRVPRRHKIIMAVLAGLVYVLCMTASLNWTTVGSYYIDALGEGPQGRYFIPLYPLLGLLACGLFRRPKNNDRRLIYTIAVLNAYGILYIFQRGIFH